MSIRQAEVADLDRSLIKRTLFAQVDYDLDLGQAADHFLADATQAVATAELGGVVNYPLRLRAITIHTPT